MSARDNPPDPQAGARDPGQLNDATAQQLIRQIDHHVRLLQLTREALICVNDEFNIVIFNQGAEKLFGHRQADIIGRPLSSLLCEQFLQKDRVRLKTLTRLARENHLAFRIEHIICKRFDGERFPSEASLSQCDLDGYRLYTLVIRDITWREQQERALTHQAEHDSLTNLPNRTLLSDRLEAAIARAARYQRRVGVFYIDLDGFKPVNDSFGHEMGDCLLQAVAMRLTDAMRQTDTVSRIGGDEFVICLEHLKSFADASAAAAKVIRALSEPHIVAGNELHITASVGISMYPDHGMDSDTLLRCADEAMYRSKDDGGIPHFYSTPSSKIR
ncbi:MAG: sensor domain-containing diguanylate cyclase [Thiogranum sp.]|nr:sensor domain-containing diguanylate cyclase [Thiogranum sp.]